MLGSNGRQPLHYGHAGSGGPARAHLAIITYVTTESGQDHHHHDYGLWIQVQTTSIDQDYECIALFVNLFSQNKPANNNQPAVLFSQNKSAPTTSQTNRPHVQTI
jgi:hypothetical protein